MMSVRRRRSGFTLLELLLASAIAAFLLGALYTAFDLVVRRAEANRDQIAASDLSRAIVNRLTSDLSSSTGLLPPQSHTTAAANAAAGGTSTSTSTSADVVDTSTDIPLPSGVVGMDKQVTIFVTRVPTALTDSDAIANPNLQATGDVRRVTYYLSEAGLCRQERPWVTADGVRNSADPDLSTAVTDVIAPEVTDITFEYFSGGVWNSEWDGAVVGTDGVTPQGPPRAIRVTLSLTYPTPSGGTRDKTVIHVIPVRAAIGSFVPDDAAVPTTTGGS